MSTASAAVFLSYASQDAKAARRLAEALRAAGVEVWFDQNELQGGDAWFDPLGQTWSVIVVRLISTKSWPTNVASRRARFGVSKRQSSSLEMFPVEMSSNLGGSRRSQNEATKSASFVTMMRPSRVASDVSSESGVRLPAGKSEAWTASCPAAVR